MHCFKSANDAPSVYHRRFTNNILNEKPNPDPSSHSSVCKTLYTVRWFLTVITYDCTRQIQSIAVQIVSYRIGLILNLYNISFATHSNVA